MDNHHPERIPPAAKHTVGTKLVAVYNRHFVLTSVTGLALSLALMYLAMVQCPNGEQWRAHPVAFLTWVTVGVVAGFAAVLCALAAGGPLEDEGTASHPGAH